jgi:hypothetical protein
MAGMADIFTLLQSPFFASCFMAMGLVLKKCETLVPSYVFYVIFGQIFYMHIR